MSDLLPNAEIVPGGYRRGPSHSGLISERDAEQVHVARQNPTSLKSIFPFDPRGAHGTLGGFREE